jgi:uncharacterized protein with PQ loop repeat
MNSVGLIGSLLLTFSAVPELIRTVKDGKCHIGWGFLLMWLIGEIFCTFYGFDLKEVPLILNYSFNLGVAGLMFFYKIKETNLSKTLRHKL